MERDAMVDRVRRRIDALADDGDAAPVLDAAAVAEASALLELAVEPHGTEGFMIVDPEAMQLAGWLHWARFTALPDGEDQTDYQTALGVFAALYPRYPRAVPAELAAVLGDSS